ncbi:MAG: peptidylprolyl isomerase [Flavihumibacter sp.]|nr:peptidylprolyl isomerase [Flavihumibacter sp.]
MQFFRYHFMVLLLLGATANTEAQKLTIPQMKTGLETAVNPMAYTREVLKKKYKLDTVAIMNATYFMSIADSLAYKGKLRKVYGPYDKKYLVQVLGRVPNTFNRISQIFIDTAVFTRRIADSLSASIINRINKGEASFEDMAQAYSMGGEGLTKGDLGWVARGALQPNIEAELAKRKKGEIFRVWSNTGLHILKKTADTKQDTGFALMLRVIL